MSSVVHPSGVIVDVRAIVPRERHPLIFNTFHGLAPGQDFVLVNDHDPKPLYYHFKAEYDGTFAWDYLDQGPEVGVSASAAPLEPGGPIRAGPSEKWRRLRLLPLAVGAGAFLAGLWVGLARLGLTLPGTIELAEFHGALMISGFRTVISLERAVAIGRWWAYSAPVVRHRSGHAHRRCASTSRGIFLLAGILLTFHSGFIVASTRAVHGRSDGRGGVLGWAERLFD